MFKLVRSNGPKNKLDNLLNETPFRLLYLFSFYFVLLIHKIFKYYKNFRLTLNYNKEKQFSINIFKLNGIFLFVIISNVSA